MSKMKKCVLLLVICLYAFLIGCGAKEEVKADSQAITEIPPLPSFIPKPERTVEEIDLPEKYSYMEEGRMPVLRNQGNTNTCWAFASLSALESSKEIGRASCRERV